MSQDLSAYHGADVFDGTRLHSGRALLVRGARVAAIVAPSDIPAGARQISLDGGLLAPGFVDLQVNGGGGILFGDFPEPAALRTIARAHARLGTTALLATLITAPPATTRAAIDAAIHATERGEPGIAGLHLEGPHLSVARKGAHDAALIRPMEPADLRLLLDAAARLPALMVTVAPENVTPEQVRQMAAAGIVVSLGHSDADYETAMRYVQAGARSVTHLFNAMSQIEGRAPGLVGAALHTRGLWAGLIADGIHVHRASAELALRAKQGAAGAVFLVSDAMSVAGTDLHEFSLNGRTVRRHDGCLRLPDGTLAGADLDLARAVRFLMGDLGWPPDQALAMATSVPATLIGAPGGIGTLAAGANADFIHLSREMRLLGVWKGGVPVPGARVSRA